MKYFIANWKMNGSREEVEAYCTQLLSYSKQSTTEPVVLALPAIYLPIAQTILKDSNVSLAAQCISEHAHGAFTGQISASMYADTGCTYALIGHSERRDSESVQSTCLQVKQCLDANIKPIVCIGETLDEKESSQTTSVLTKQLSPILDLIENPHDIWVAYEPRWAIGSGLTPDKNEINITSKLVKNLIKTKFLYGGSVTLKNIQNLISCDIDGFLVGGASLDYNVTEQMVNICTHYF